MHKHDDITLHATSFPSRILWPTEKDPGPGWAGCVLAFVLGADSILGALRLLGLLQYDSYLCTCLLFPRTVGGFSSYLLYPQSSPGRLHTPSRIKINTASEGRAKGGISEINQKKTMIIWGLRCWDTQILYLLGSYVPSVLGASTFSGQFFLKIRITHSWRALARACPLVNQ